MGHSGRDQMRLWVMFFSEMSETLSETYEMSVFTPVRC